MISGKVYLVLDYKMRPFKSINFTSAYKNEKVITKFQRGNYITATDTFLDHIILFNMNMLLSNSSAKPLSKMHLNNNILVFCTDYIFINF